MNPDLLDSRASQVVLVVKNSPANVGNLRDTDMDSIPGLGRLPGGGHGNPLQSSCLENPMDRGAWQAMVPGVTKNRTQLKQLSMHMHMQLDSRAPSLPIQLCFSNCTMHAEHLGTS